MLVVKMLDFVPQPKLLATSLFCVFVRDKINLYRKIFCHAKTV
jgi:hypothetical protein